MSGSKEDSTSVQGADAEPVDEQSEQPQPSNNNMCQPLTPPTGTSEYANDIARQLMELRELNSQSSQIIALLKKGFKLPPDISSISLRVRKNTKNGWAHPYPLTHREPDERCVSEDFLDTMLPCGTPLIQVLESNESPAAEGFFIASECKKWMLHDNLKQALKVFILWTLHGYEPPTCFGITRWTPLIIANGKTIQNSRQCYPVGVDIEKELESLWPDKWTVQFARESHKGYYGWRISGVNPPQEDEQDMHFQLRDISVPWIDKPKVERLDFVSHSMDCPLIGFICLLAVDPSRKVLDFDTVATIISLSQTGAYYTSTHDLLFLQGHFGPWCNDRKQLRHDIGLYEPFRYQFVGRGLEKLVIWDKYTYFMRSFTAITRGEPNRSFKTADENLGTSPGRHDSASGLHYERDLLSIIESPEKGVWLHETRYSTSLTMTSICRPIGNFRLFSIVDGNRWDFPKSYHWSSQESDCLKKWHLHSAGPLTGIAVLQVEIHAFIEPWAHDWNKTIDHLSGIVSITLESVEDKQNLDNLMYDPDLRNTKLYFKVLQILRMFSDSLRAAKGELNEFSNQVPADRLRDSCHLRDNLDEIMLVINHNWDVVKSYQDAKSRQILSRIAILEEELKSLRDGLFNAQSIKEAQKSRQLNKILMVFTTVTTLFLPLTFVATFFSLDFFHASSGAQTRKTFSTVAALVTGLTFLLSLAAIYGVMTSAARWNQLYIQIRRFMQVKIPQTYELLITKAERQTRSWLVARRSGTVYDTDLSDL